jgi:hypothetical protein
MKLIDEVKANFTAGNMRTAALKLLGFYESALGMRSGLHQGGDVKILYALGREMELQEDTKTRLILVIPSMDEFEKMLLLWRTRDMYKEHVLRTPERIRKYEAFMRSAAMERIEEMH